MVRPVRFAFNEETAANNAFQQKSESAEAALKIQQQAVGEFDAYVELLRRNGVTVDVFPYTTLFRSCVARHARTLHPRLDIPQQLFLHACAAR